MRDGRITAVQAADEAVRATEVVDAGGQYLIPGLWDFHVHLTYDARFTEAMPGLFLNHGITSIRDTGGPLELVVPVVERMRAEGVTAPRVFFAGPLMDGEHVVYDGKDRPLLGIGNPDAETARANMARLAEGGGDQGSAPAPQRAGCLGAVGGSHVLSAIIGIAHNPLDLLNHSPRSQ